MRKIIFVLLASVLICYLMLGCVRVKFVAKDGTSVEYTRIFTNVDRIEGNIGGNKVQVGNSTVNLEALTSLISSLPK